MSLAHRCILFAMATLALPACGSSDGGPADPGPGNPGPPPTPAIAISVSAPSVTVQAGANGAVTASISRSGGYTGPVTIATTGAPAGVAAAESNVVTTGTSTTGTITVTVGAAVAAGSYPLTVTASGTGVSSVQVALTLEVTEAPPTPDFSLTATSPPALARGASTDVPVTITRTNFTGPVTLSATGVPSGVTAAFSPLAPTGTTSTFTLQVGAAVAPGSYPIGIAGTGTPGTRTGMITLVISVAGSYTLAATPNAVTMAPSGSATTTVAVSPSGGFSRTVALRVAGLPAGMTAAFAPSTTSTTSTLTVVTDGAAAGTYPLTITGETAGLPDVNTSLAVTVMAVSGSTTITLDYSACVDEDFANWVAYRDGPAAPWTVVPGVNDRYTFTLSGDLGGVTLANNTEGLVTILERTTWLSDYAARPCVVAQPERAINGTAIGLPANADGMVSFGTSGVGVRTASPDFSLDELPLGPHDLFGYVRTGAGVGSGDRGVIRRDVDPAPPGTVSPLDFSGSESFVPRFATVSVVGAGGQPLSHSMSYVTRNNSITCDIATIYDDLFATGTTLPAYGVPAIRQRPTDHHLLNIRTETSSSQTLLFQETVETFGPLVTRTVVLPAAFNPTVSRVTGGSHHRLRVQGTLSNGLEGLIASSTGAFTDRVMFSFVGRDWLTGAAVDVTSPDLTGLTGFNPAWAPGVLERLEYTVVGVTRIPSVGFAVECQPNARRAGAGKEGVLPD